MAGAAFAFSDRILWELGAILTSAEEPQEADIVVVIGGDWQGNRVLKAADLVRRGFATRVLVSGAGKLYGRFEPDLAVEFAVSHGYPREYFIQFIPTAHSTVEEARLDLAELRRRGLHKYLMVTSDYHTARAGRIFRREGKDLEEHTVSAPDPDWQGGHWWKSREGRKLWLTEAQKTVADYLGI